MDENEVHPDDHYSSHYELGIASLMRDRAYWLTDSDPDASQLAHDVAGEIEVRILGEPRSRRPTTEWAYFDNVEKA